MSYADSIGLLAEKVFFGKQRDFEKGDEMACCLPRSCTKVLRVGKNTTNAHIKRFFTSFRMTRLFRFPRVILASSEGS